MRFSDKLKKLRAEHSLSQEGLAKTSKIVEELTSYFFSIGATMIESKIEVVENHMKITFRANYLPEYEEDIEYLRNCLDNDQKNDGIEDVYWELIGSGTSGESSELLLLGMLVDAFELQKLDNEVELLLYKEWIV